MKTFGSIDELLKALGREKVLLRELFSKRKTVSLRYNDACELVDGHEDRLEFLLNFGIIRKSGDLIELEDVYMDFFENVLEVNEVINIQAVNDYISKLNENIEWYLKEGNERRRQSYIKEIKRTLRTIANATVRNVIDLKRNIDNTYKNEPNYAIKIDKLHKLDEKRESLKSLITTTEDILNHQQPTFFKIALDIDMNNLVIEVKYRLNESYHNILEIERQIIEYINIIEYQNKIVGKIRRLKYLRDQMTIEEFTDIRVKLNEQNPLWMEPAPRYSLKLSLDSLREDTSFDSLIKDALTKFKTPESLKRKDADAISADFLNPKDATRPTPDRQEIKNAFLLQSNHLFAFVRDYHYSMALNDEDILLLFCQIAVQYSSEFNFTDNRATYNNFNYPLIYPK